MKYTKYKHRHESKAGGGIFSRYNNPCTAILIKHIIIIQISQSHYFKVYFTLNSFLVLLGFLLVYAFRSYYSTVKCKISHLRIVLSRQSPFLAILIKRSELTHFNTPAPFNSTAVNFEQLGSFFFHRNRLLFSICF